MRLGYFFKQCQGKRTDPRTRRDAEIFAFERGLTERETLLLKKFLAVDRIYIGSRA